MIQFNELRVSEYNRKLIIDASVIDLSYYTDVYIEEIVIDSQDTFIGTGPSITPIYTFTVPEVQPSGGDYTHIYGNVKNLRLELTSEQLNGKSLDTTMFFVYVKAKGVPAVDTPCGMDNVNTLGVAANLAPMYRKSIKLLSQFSDTCSKSSSGLSSFVLQLNGLDLALKTCNYLIAIKYWKKYFTGTNVTLLTNTCSTCGCN